MSLEYQPELTAYRLAIINVEMGQNKYNKTLAGYTISIRNDGPEPLSNLKIYLRMFGGQLVNVSDEYTVEDVFYVFSPEIIGPEETYTVSLNISYPESVISLAPRARVVLGDMLLYVTELSYFENVLSFVQYLYSTYPWPGADWLRTLSSSLMNMRLRRFRLRVTSWSL